MKLPDPFCLSPQLPCICADGKILVLIGAQIEDESEGSLDKEVRRLPNVNVGLGKLNDKFPVKKVCGLIR